MISVQDAQKTILENTSTLASKIVLLTEALGHTISEDVLAPIDMPPFDNSAMDGYAIREWEKSEYAIIAEVQAGADASEIQLKEGQAIRIFTGAMVPESATTVVKQEIIRREGDTLHIIEPFKRGGNIRRKGEQIEMGAVALEAGTTLNSASIGYLAMLGITQVKAYQKPVIKILVTGDELAEAGTALKPGQIYESNGVTLISALQELGFTAEAVRVQDDYQATYDKIQTLLQSCDVLLTSGGISVGDYDFIEKALLENGVTTHFYKVKQKPGKPLFYGSTDHCQVFGLPGNPASALTCTYIYVVTALRQLMGARKKQLAIRTLSLKDDYTKRAGLTHFLKGKLLGNEVATLSHQSSSMLHSYAAANCLIEIPEDADELPAGTLVNVHMLP